MPKRGYPFPESFSSQYKIHVGQRELTQRSMFGDKQRQEIYEKTKNLLSSGARAVMGKICNMDGLGKCTEPQPTQAAIPVCSQRLLKGQTLIGHDGKLIRATTAQGSGAQAGLAGCCVCQKSQRIRTTCSQCDRPVCHCCTQQCSSCSSLCCSVCTIIDYSGRYDQVLCCGCSS
ncbi:apoptosis regulatory protein Siva [Lampris incognitus]|uniref:apoptosis regulatory protein Siva n=1 Tax=Lampris incognitus TaxID=2546036 RepID=UPI0024B5F080|nr:apoptosis regulatory protein Siva [Lampris incognitus]